MKKQDLTKFTRKTPNGGYGRGPSFNRSRFDRFLSKKPPFRNSRQQGGRYNPGWKHRNSRGGNWHKQPRYVFGKFGGGRRGFRRSNNRRRLNPVFSSRPAPKTDRRAPPLRPLLNPYRLKNLKRPRVYRGRAPLYKGPRKPGYSYYARLSPVSYFFTSKAAWAADEAYRDTSHRRDGNYAKYYHGYRAYMLKALRLRKVTTFLTVRETGNNFFLTVFKRSGQMIFYKSAGMLKFTGPRRGTKEAAMAVMAASVERLRELKIGRIGIVIRGPAGYIVRKTIKSFFRLYRDKLVYSSSFIISLRAKSHNGLRGKKLRR